jgi:hypothetical protein
MWYFRGAPPDPPIPEDPGMILFLFFSLASATAFIILSWSMVALAKVIIGQVGGLDQAVLHLDGKPFKEEVGFLLIHINMVGPKLGKGVELSSVVENCMVPLLKIQKLLQFTTE